jgi:hypothetical protein
MKIQDQVCTEQQADRLKELGIVQESLFYHTHSDWGVMPKKSIDFSGDPSSAFTVAELGVLLHLSPYSVYLKTDNIVFWHADYEHMPFGAFETEAEAKAAILIHQLDNNIITPAEVNQRLNQ